MARSPVPSAAPAVAAPVGRKRRSTAASLLRSLRPYQWTKNLFVFFGLIFGEQLLDATAVARASLAFVIFCALSSAIYLINDLRDREADRMHPVKALRPIASGDLAPGVAGLAAGLLGAGALGASAWLGGGFLAVAGGYFLLMVTYSAVLKHLVILDVLTIAIGFVLRAAGGAVAIDVPISHWLLLLTLLLALFLGLSKRRAEIVALAEGARNHRRILDEYSPYLLDQMISVVTASTLLAYAFYTIHPDTVQRFGTDRLLWTVPFPLYGIFRYLYLVHQRQGGGNPSELLLADRPLLACVALWGFAVIAILYGPLR
ncbi:MAG: decaprenyl-phosphate phosphoribosyltransferase [Vicinamibacterales bacterium]